MRAANFVTEWLPGEPRAGPRPSESPILVAALAAYPQSMAGIEAPDDIRESRSIWTRLTSVDHLLGELSKEAESGPAAIAFRRMATAIRFGWHERPDKAEAWRPRLASVRQHQQTFRRCPEPGGHVVGRRQSEAPRRSASWWIISATAARVAP